MTDHAKPGESLSDSMAPHPSAPRIGTLSRRGFIGAALGGGALAGLSASAQTPAGPPLEEVKRQFFNESEWRQISALCDALIPGEGDGGGCRRNRGLEGFKRFELRLHPAISVVSLVNSGTKPRRRMRARCLVLEDPRGRQCQPREAGHHRNASACACLEQLHEDHRYQPRLQGRDAQGERQFPAADI